MAKWWLTDDRLGFADEKLITSEMTKKTILAMLMAEILAK
ncbi:hypothetical protein RU96_GL001213 [Enterococcus canintestini]|uniref:Uncharacterized protein n=2 Tax=Enterococcus canintestini TaxID=317010 RepID=A0A1L8R9M2_9ENTE|nr:hypothetical protein RU96_GL001213 [Enterococcus canintestini]